MSPEPRPLVLEPFANQLETIEKALIEVHNQPSSYFGRRNRPINNGSHSNIMNSSNSNKNSNINSNINTVGTNTNSHTNIHTIINANINSNINSNINNTNLSSSINNISNMNHNKNAAGPNINSNVNSMGYAARNSAAKGFYPQYEYQMDYHEYRNIMAREMAPALDSAAQAFPYDRTSRSHIPQVFHDDKVFSDRMFQEKMYQDNPSREKLFQEKVFQEKPFHDKSFQDKQLQDEPFSEFSSDRGFGLGAAGDGKMHEGLATFDPFSKGDEYSSTAFYPLPTFNSSNNLLNSNYTSSSSNIWRRGGKNMAGDAAVWG